MNSEVTVELCSGLFMNVMRKLSSGDEYWTDTFKMKDAIIKPTEAPKDNAAGASKKKKVGVSTTAVGKGTSKGNASNKGCGAANASGGYKKTLTSGIPAHTLPPQQQAGFSTVPKSAAKRPALAQLGNSQGNVLLGDFSKRMKGPN
jgi:hypothetical protein